METSDTSEFATGAFEECTFAHTGLFCLKFSRLLLCFSAAVASCFSLYPDHHVAYLPFAAAALLSQLPTVLRLWLQPAPDGRAFLPSPQRASLLKVLMVLPVQKSHLRESGLGKLVVAMSAHPGETRDNQELSKQARGGLAWLDRLLCVPGVESSGMNAARPEPGSARIP